MNDKPERAVGILDQEWLGATMTLPRLFTGCDPDMHTMAFAVVKEDLSIHEVSVVRSKGGVSDMIKALAATEVPRSLVLAHAFAVESQELYLAGSGRTKNPRDILHLGQVAGAAYLLLAQWSGEGYFPVPGEWKGNVPKKAHQYRVLKRAGIADEHIGEMGGKNPYCFIKGPAGSGFAEGLNPGDWKHVTDAVGLAQYAAMEYLYEQRKQALLNKVRS